MCNDDVVSQAESREIASKLEMYIRVFVERGRELVETRLSAAHMKFGSKNG